MGTTLKLRNSLSIRPSYGVRGEEILSIRPSYGVRGEEILSIRPSYGVRGEEILDGGPLFLFPFHFSPFPQKRLILRLVKKEKENFVVACLTSSIKHEIRHFHVVAVQ